MEIGSVMVMQEPRGVGATPRTWDSGKGGERDTVIISERRGSGWGLEDGIRKDLGPHSPNFVHRDGNT